MMVVCHDNDLKVLHVDIFDTTKFSVYMSRIYVVLIVHRFKVHNYLVMYLFYRNQVAVNISMIKYL